MDNQKVSVFIRGVPRVVRDHFKSICALRGQNMTEVIVKYMRDTVNAHREEEKELNWVRGSK